MMQVSSQQSNVKVNRLGVTVGVVSESEHRFQYTFSDETLLTYFLDPLTKSGADTEIAMCVVAEALILSDLKHLASHPLYSINPIEYERAALVRQLLTNCCVSGRDDNLIRVSLNSMLCGVGLA